MPAGRGAVKIAPLSSGNETPRLAESGTSADGEASNLFDRPERGTRPDDTVRPSKTSRPPCLDKGERLLDCCKDPSLLIAKVSAAGAAVTPRSL